MVYTVTGKNPELFNRLAPQLEELIKKCAFSISNLKSSEVQDQEFESGAMKTNANEIQQEYKKAVSQYNNEILFKETVEDIIQIASLEFLKYNISKVGNSDLPHFYFDKEIVSPTQIMIKHNDARLLIETKNLLCLRSYLNDTDFFLIEKERMFGLDRLQTGINLKNWQKFLHRNGYSDFIQIHRSCIINMSKQIGYKSSELYLPKEITYRVDEYIVNEFEKNKTTITTTKLSVTAKYKTAVIKYFENSSPQS